MRKNLCVCLILSLILVFSLGNISYANDSDAALPSLRLSVQPSMLGIYPPIMIYTAQLSSFPTSANSVLTVDFYNIVSNSPVQLSYLGSATVDNTGKAVLYKQMSPGVYTGVAKLDINNNTIVSNVVTYRVN